MLKPHCSEIYIYIYLFICTMYIMYVYICIFFFSPLLADPGDLRITLR